jgi:hypothetical protein
MPQSTAMTPRALLLAGALIAGLAGAATTGAAADINGSAVIAGTSTDNDGLRSDILEQNYNLGLFQRLTPYVSVRFGYQYFDLATTFPEQGTDFTRRSRQPLVELLYKRQRLSGRLAVFEQKIENTLQAESFDRRSLGANLSWQPTRWPRLDFNFREDRNIADVSVFGTDVNSRVLQLRAFYNRRHWTAGYDFERIGIDNRSNSLQTEQTRHGLRGSASKGFWGERVSLGFSGRLSRLGRTTTLGEDTELADPVLSVAGLFAVDLSPEIGELDDHPSLIDGDVQTPASPPVDIGGGSTFRNIGVDVGVTRPVSRLEIAVDNLSGPGVVWQVYHSRDNLIWEPLLGVTSEFDVALLRYRIRFPDTEDRFFKAVNVSANPEPVVRVTEIRALLDLDAEAGTDTSETNLYRADVQATFEPARRVRGAVGFGLSSDDTFSAGLVRRDYNERHAFARLSFDLTRELDLHLGYRWNDSENLRQPVLLRTVSSYSANLNWVPLPTVDAILAVGRRDESEKGTPIQSLSSVRLGVVTQLLSDLRLVSDVDLSRLEDPFAQRDRETLTWRETLEMQPFPRWTLGGGFTWSRSEDREGAPLLRRTQYRVLTTWNATSYLSLGGTWWYSKDGGNGALNQSLFLSYTPGRKLAISAAYQGFDGSFGRSTTTDAVSVSYRLFTRLILFANLSRSRTEEGDGETIQISNLRAGLRLAF